MPKVVVLFFYTSTNNVSESGCSASSSSFGGVSLFNFSHSHEYPRYGMGGSILNMVSTYISLMINDFPPHGYPVVPAAFVAKILPFLFGTVFNPHFAGRN